MPTIHKRVSISNPPSNFGYLIPWYFVLQYITIEGMSKPSPKHSGDQVLVDLGTAIRNARKDAGLSQEALAAEAGLDRSYMGGIERGEHNLTVVSLIKVSNALSTTPSALFLSFHN
jgi:DNA-binding XRE family transcriptional regulator